VHYKQEQCVSLFFQTGKSHVRYFCCLLLSTCKVKYFLNCLVTILLMSEFFYFRINSKHLLVQNTTVLYSFNSSIIKTYWMYLIILLNSDQTMVKSTPPNHWFIMFFLFNLIICVVNCVFYLIPNQIIALLCCLFNLIIRP
jgi:hypothetical protein